MSPTLASSLVLNSGNEESESESIMECEVKRIAVSTSPEGEGAADILKESELRFIVEEVEKLKQTKGNSHVINYRKVWFEGALADKLAGLSCSPPAEMVNPSPSPSSSAPETFVCVERERIVSISLEEWLKDRRQSILSTAQILHLTAQLAKAVNYLVQSGVQMKKGVPELSSVHIICSEGPQSHFAPNSEYLPQVKLARVFQFEVALESLEKVVASLSPSSPPLIEDQSLVQWLARIFWRLGENGDGHNGVASQVSKLLEEMLASPTTPDLKNLVAKLDELKESFKTGVIFNLGQPSSHFVGRDMEVKNLQGILTESGNKIVVVHGPPAIGKSELVTQLCRGILERKSATGKNGIWLEASSPDNLTASLYTCANLQNISTKDYVGQPRILKDIFLEMLASFSESDLLLVFDNADVLSMETLDLIEMFKENCLSSCSGTENHHHRHRHHLILITRELWRSCPFLEDSNCTTLYLSQISRKAAGSLLKIESEHELLGSPAAVKILMAYLKGISEADKDGGGLLKSIENFEVEHPGIFECVETPSLRPALVAYQFSLWRLYQSLENDHRKDVLCQLLYLLEHVDGNCGIFKETLIELFDRFTSVPADSLPQLLSQLCDLQLIQITDGVIRLSGWRQTCIKTGWRMISGSAGGRDSNCDKLLSAYFLVLSSKSSEGDCWKVISHAAKYWRISARLNPDVAKRFDLLPDLIGKLVGKSFKKLELIAGFLKECMDIFSSAYQDPYDIHVLRLKILVTVDSLLAKGRTNEAFIVFKGIQDHCRTEPREYLMIKLRSLVELGKIHVERQEYQKAISCYQQVHILAAQKISTLQQDSEPIVLEARMRCGRAYLQQGNMEEAKKILLEVIPLLERYSGEEEHKDKVKALVVEARFSLGVILRKNGDLVNALMIQTKVLEEREATFGQCHPNTWASKQEMALLYSAYDNHEKALLILRQLLEVQEEHLGAPSNRTSLATMNAIAEVEARLCNFEDALELYEAIELIEREVLVEGDEMRISSQLSQAEVLQNLGQYKEAMDIYDLVYTLQSSKIPSTSATSTLCQDILGRREKAERSMEVLGNYWLSLTPSNVDDPSELGALAKKHEVAVQLSENQDNHGALRFLREVLEDLEGGRWRLEQNNRFHLNVKADLARVLGLVGRFNESFSVYKEIIPLMDATFGETDELTMLCKDTMGQVFLFSGNQFLKRQMSNLKWFLF